MFTIKNDNFCINIYDLIHDCLPEDKHLEMAESLSCSDVVIKHVVDQIINGWTENMSHGAESSSIEEKYHTPLQKARRRIANESSEVAKVEIERLQWLLESVQEQKNEYMNKYFDMYHNQYNPSLPG